MSTRGCVAVGNRRSWKGIYNHSDSYPGGLGRDVFTRARAHAQSTAYVSPRAGLQVFGEALFHFTRWETFVTNGSGHQYTGHIHSTEPDPLHIEWVYVIDSEAEALHVLASKEVDPGVVSDWYTPGKPCGPSPRKLKKGVWDYGHCRYRHAHVVSIPFASEAEPNWYMISKFQHDWENFDAALMFHPTPPKPPTSFERVLSDNLED